MENRSRIWRRTAVGISVILFLCSAVTKSTSGQAVVFRNFPQRKDIGILCWSIPGQTSGSLSQIVVFGTSRVGISKLLWASPLDNSYSPQIRFVPEIRNEGLSLALVQRQTGTASSELQIVGKTAGRFAVLFHADGFKFDVAPLDGSKPPFIIVHSDASILDVPEIYRWNGSRFVIDSAAHPHYYRELLAQDRKTVASDASAPVLINLSRIAVLSGDRAAAKTILDEALANERSKGRDANPKTLRGIRRALRSFGRAPQ